MAVAQPTRQQNATPHDIRTISGWRAARGTAKSRKDNARLAKEVSNGYKINITEHTTKVAKKEAHLIVFLDEDAKRLIRPHNDALVVTLLIANR